jgi:hypothetical protein
MRPRVKAIHAGTDTDGGLLIRKYRHNEAVNGSSFHGDQVNIWIQDYMVEHVCVGSSEFKVDLRGG